MVNDLFQIPYLNRWLRGRSQFSMGVWFKQTGENCSCVEILNNADWSMCEFNSEGNFFINAGDANTIANYFLDRNGTAEPCYTVRIFVIIILPCLAYPVVSVDRWSATDDLATNSVHSSRLSAFLMAAPSVKPVNSGMLSSHLFFCLPRLLPPLECALHNCLGKT